MESEFIDFLDNLFISRSVSDRIDTSVSDISITLSPLSSYMTKGPLYKPFLVISPFLTSLGYIYLSCTSCYDMLFYFSSSPTYLSSPKTLATVCHGIRAISNPLVELASSTGEYPLTFRCLSSLLRSSPKRGHLCVLLCVCCAAPLMQDTVVKTLVPDQWD